jgi:ABC-type uncharacterized transport system auxiliary subunit
LLLVLAGCGTSQPVPEDRFYQLELDLASVNPAAAVIHGGLKVERVESDPLRNGRAVLYRDAGKPLELQRYHYEYWVDKPPRMIRQALVQYLRHSGVADSVYDGKQPGAAEYRLQTRLLQFEQVLDAGRPQVVVELEASLYANRAGGIIWNSTYRQQQESTARHMHATAQAMRSALEKVFRSALEDLRVIDLGS